MSASKRPARPWLRTVLIVPAVLVLAAASFVGAKAVSKKKPAAAPTTRTVQATIGTMDQTVSASGTLAPADTEDLSFSASGTVTAVNVKAGQKVAKGQVLATIDSAALESQVVQARAQVAADESTLSTDESADAATAQLTADRANLSSDTAQLASAKTALAGASLVSPIAGMIASVDLAVGQQLGSTGGSATSLTGSKSGSGATNAAAASSSSATTGSTSGSSAEIEVVSTALVVNLSVDDTEISEIKTGQAATVSATSGSNSTGGSGFGGFGGFGRRAAASGNGTGTGTGNGSTTGTGTTGTTGATTTTTAATAAKVTSVGVIASASSGVASFPVVVQVTGSTAGLYSGATAQVTITYKQLTNVIEVPTLAVTQTNGQSFVTVSAGGKQTKTAVTTGITSGGEVQITSGLTAGQQVVVTIPSFASGRANTGTGGIGNAPTGAFPGGEGGFTPRAGFGSGG